MNRFIGSLEEVELIASDTPPAFTVVSQCHAQHNAKAWAIHRLMVTPVTNVSGSIKLS
jgi:hypothetical protein